jgi:hypothetical protein
MNVMPEPKGVKMKKQAQPDETSGILTADKARDDRPAGPDNGPEQDAQPGAKPGASRNIYTEIIHSLMDKNRKRVTRYYCANSRCPTTFFDSARGFQCPACGSMGIISEYKHDTAHEDDMNKPVLGYLDTIGRLFCSDCTHRHGLIDEVSMVIYRDSDPYRSENCDVCRMPLNKTEQSADR